MERFTKTELILLQEMNLGVTPKDFAKNHFITLGTVKNHIYNIRKKFGCETQVQMILGYQKLLTQRLEWKNEF